MKFKKRLLSEEVGLPKTNKQNYTKGKKQRVVVFSKSKFEEGMENQSKTLHREKSKAKVKKTPVK